jgi:hypothetical protein
VTGWAWWFPALAVVAGAAAGYFAVRSVTCRGAGRAVCGAHALMGAGMAAMFWSWVRPVPATAGALVFAVLGAWFAARRLRGGNGAGAAGHVAVGCAAMVVMYLGISVQSPSAGTTGNAGHAGHLAAFPGTAGLLTVVVGLALTGYFAWHAWETTSRTRETTAGRGGTAVLPRVRTDTTAHVVLDALMAVMFFSAL